jgi:hypothetical protein
MFKAAYSTDFYRAVRNALHAEVSSWSEPDLEPETASGIAALWRTVEELEAVSRQSDAFALPERPYSSGLIMPLPTLSPAGEI